MNEKKYLEAYRKEDYEKLSLTVDILIFGVDNDFNLQILLKRRADYPYKDFWAIPGGFVGIEESLDNAAKRVLAAKTGLKGLHMEQLYTFGDKDRDPRMRIVSVAYIALLSRGASVLDSDMFTDSDELEFKRVSELGSLDLAFDHKAIIDLAIGRMQGKLNYTDIALKLLSSADSFTIYELQKIYEAIDNKAYDVSNFRRYFKNRYESTGLAIKTGALCRAFSKRPSSYYKIITK